MVIMPSRYYYCLGGDNVDANLFKFLLKASRKPIFKTLYFDDLYRSREGSRCCFIDPKSGNKRQKSKKKKCSSTNTHTCDLITTNECLKILAKQCSLPNMSANVDKCQPKRYRSETYLNTSTPFRTKYIVNSVLLDLTKIPSECLEVLTHPLTRAQLRIYQCQHNANQDNVCCSCDSDEVFEVMKSLYEYRNKKMSEPKISYEKKVQKIKKVKKGAVKKVKHDLLPPFVEQTLKKREIILKGLASLVLPLQGGKPNSLNVISNVEKCMFFPLEQKTADYSAKLQNSYYFELPQTADEKFPSRKNTVTKKHNDMHIDLSNKKTQREFVEKNKIRSSKITPDKLGDKTVTVIKETSRLPTPSVVGEKTINTLAEKGLSNIGSVEKNQEKSEKINFTQSILFDKCHKETSDNLSSLKGKMQEKNIYPISTLPKINNFHKVRKDLDHPSERTKANDKKKEYTVSYVAGFVSPFEGKTKVLTAQTKVDALPKGQTQLEKTFINKVTKEIQTGFGTEIRSGKMSKAKARAAGLWTPLEGKKPQQKEKLLRGLIQHGISLPEGNTESVNNLISKVRRDMGLPPAPKTKADKEKYAAAQAFGLITPLQGKTAQQKERILRTLAKRNIPLPEGRTASEKALIIKIGKEVKPMNSSESFHKKKAAVFVIDGKPTKPKEIIMRDLVKLGMPVSEDKTEAKIRLMNEIRKDSIGLYEKQTVDTEKEKYTDSQFNVFVKPLNERISQQKENNLKRLKKTNKSLSEDKTKLKKALIDTVRNAVQSSITSIKVSTKTIVISHNKKGVHYLQPPGETNQNKKTESRNSHAQLTNTLPGGRAKVNKMGKSTSFTPKLFGLITAKEKYNEAEQNGLISLPEETTTLQKQTLLVALADNGVVLPEVKLVSEKTITNINSVKDKPLNQLILTQNASEPLDELSNKVIKGNNKCNNMVLTPIFNIIGVPDRKPLLEQAKTMRTRTAVKDIPDISKERSPKLPSVTGEPLREGKKNIPNKKLRNKVSTVIKAQGRALGGFAEAGDVTPEKKLDDKKDPTLLSVHVPTATYAGSLRLEAASFSTPYIDDEFMTSAQKSIFQVLSTYLSHIEVD